MSISLSGISKTYGDQATRVEALKSIDLQIEQGEFVCLWGASGSGKSTLLNILGLLDAADSGVYTLEGADVAGLSDVQRTHLRSKRIGFIFQSFNLIPVLSAVENVMLPLQVQGVSERSAREQARELLERVGLVEEMDRLPDKISGGQRQRVATARALVCRPALVLADEPTANLDSATGTRILQLMRDLNRHQATTLVVATHNPELVSYASRKLTISDGGIT